LIEKQENEKMQRAIKKKQEILDIQDLENKKL
jgi:hypothetical protein